MIQSQGKAELGDDRVRLGFPGCWNEQGFTGITYAV